MYRLSIFKSGIGYVVEIYSQADYEYPLHSLFAFKKHNAIKKAQAYINNLNGKGRGWVEDVYYSPQETK